MDENVPLAISEALCNRGLDVLRVHEDGFTQTPDIRILDRAAELERIVFTRDADFLREAKIRHGGSVPFLGVIYAHQERASIGQCINDLELICNACSAEELKNRVVYIPLQ
jgi:predicted nuclease of predicted toxin-antitoxin system